jgi:glycosyltransferase involved in cell wall biosynthesis
MATAIARLRKRPVVITQHMGALGLGSRWLTLLYQSTARLLGKLMFPAAAQAVFISANVRRFFERQSDKHSRLIFNGIDVDRFVAAPAHTRRLLQSQLGLSADRPAILFVGRFVRKKGLHIIETLTRRFPQVEWLFVGSGPEDPAKWERPNVRVVGRLGHDALAHYYQACDLLLLPSYGEGFPLVVQEALACGLGVLSTDEVATACPAAQQLIRAVPTPRAHAAIDSWQTALSTVLSDVDYLEARTFRSDEARRLWSWARCTAEYLEVFAEVRHPN